MEEKEVTRFSELNTLITRDLLYDFYGDLLTEHQKHIFEEVCFNDCSVSEVAREAGVSRQSISDLVRRTTDQLYSYEEKLGLAEKFRKQSAEIRGIRELAEGFLSTGDRTCIEKIAALADKLLEEEA